MIGMWLSLIALFIGGDEKVSGRRIDLKERSENDRDDRAKVVNKLRGAAIYTN